MDFRTYCSTHKHKLKFYCSSPCKVAYCSLCAINHTNHLAMGLNSQIEPSFASLIELLNLKLEKEHQSFKALKELETKSKLEMVRINQQTKQAKVFARKKFKKVIKLLKKEYFKFVEEIAQKSKKLLKSQSEVDCQVTEEVSRSFSRINSIKRVIELLNSPVPFEVCEGLRSYQELSSQEPLTPNFRPKSSLYSKLESEVTVYTKRLKALIKHKYDS